MNQKENHLSKSESNINFNEKLKNSSSASDKDSIVQNPNEVSKPEQNNNSAPDKTETKNDPVFNQNNNAEKKEHTEKDLPKKEKGKPRAKRLGLWSTILAAMFVASIAVINISNTSGLYETKISTSEGAQEILKQRWSDKLELGARLIKNDDQVTLEPVDMTFTHNKADETTKMWVWDFAAEDGDYVHILVDGKPISEPFMIKNKPVSFDVSKNSVINVIGIRDGGGGITYAIHVEAIGQTYLNAAGINQSNTYTMKYEPVMK